MKKYILLIAVMAFSCSFTGCKKNDVLEGMEPDGIIQETDVYTDEPGEILMETEGFEDDGTIIVDEEMITGEEEGTVINTEE